MKRVRPMCPRCSHPSAGHQIGTCLVKVGRNTRGPEGETVIHLCGCAVWQGPRPWLQEGSAWRYDERGYLR